MADTRSGPVNVRLANGAEFELADAATAERVYPDATIIGYAPRNAEFVHAKDESVIAAREAKEKQARRTAKADDKGE